MHVFSTLFDAKSVDNELRTEEGCREAVKWCRKTGVTKVYIESFRKVFIEREHLEKLRDFFEEEGFKVDGCVTPVGFPKPGTRYGEVPCLSYLPNCELLEEIFRRTAAVFNTIMIDDFLFTACECDECKKELGGRSFADYHADIMHEVSIERIIKPAKEINPNCKIIIKYPNWYDIFYHGWNDGGYDVIRQTEVFDQIWAGNETREPDSEYWGRYPQTMAAYVMSWDIKLGERYGGKCMGGWYDHFSTLPATYLEQARNTILGGARESMLFCYKQLHESKEGIIDVATFRTERESLHRLAYLIENKKMTGVSVPKKPNADAETEKYIAGMYGMLGIPVVPDIELDKNAQAVIFGAQAVKYPNVRVYAKDMLAAGKSAAFTEGFLAYTNFEIPADSNAVVFKPDGDIWNLTKIPQNELDSLRNYLLTPFGLKFYAPSRVGLSLFDDDMEVIQNFNDNPVDITVSIDGRNGKSRKIVLTLSDGKEAQIKRVRKEYILTVPSRTLIVLN
ncbi:MAG: hypothetical protein FWD71_08685 [Oscillospiraceae bacterium]|nr:hypothetical protein [Oscillospiraceae bacterium]